MTDKPVIAGRSPDKRRDRNRVRVFDASNPGHLYLNGLTENSAKTMERALDAIAKMLGYQYMDEMDWCELQRHHVQGLMNLLANEGKSPATQALYLSAIKGTLKEAWLAKMITADHYHTIAELKKPRGSRITKGQALDLSDVAKALDACEDNSKSGIRDKAILALLLGAGLRRMEVATLHLWDIDYGKGDVKVTGKGNKERIVPVEEAVLDCLIDWIAIRGEWDGPLFCPIRKGSKISAGTLSGGNIGNKALSDSSIYLICRTRGIQVDVDELKPHNLRRTFGTEHDKSGSELEVICDLLGHSSIDTTRTYIYNDKEVKKRRAMLQAQLIFHTLKA
jgi:integrase/recombinase XerD